MIDLNELRDRAATFGSDYLTDEEWVEVIDRLEAAESDALEQARLNGMGASREAALLAKLEAAEKDIALKERIIDALGSALNAAANERECLLDALREMLVTAESVNWDETFLEGARAAISSVEGE